MLSGASRVAGSSFVVPEPLFDGVVLHASLLRHGFDIWLFPGQVLVGHSEGQSSGQLSFVHGVPERTRLSSATFAHDKRVRRALLERAGVPVPKGASFSLGKGLPGARRFARSIGYPVVVKPAQGDNTIEVVANVKSRNELDEALEYFSVTPTQRDGFVRSSYALSQARKPGGEGELQPAPGGYRILVERHVFGKYLRVLIVEGSVHSIVLCDDGPWAEPGSEVIDVGAEVHPSIQAMALDAYKCVPGLSVAVVDIVADSIWDDAGEQTANVVELSERPWLYTLERVGSGRAGEAGDEMLRQMAERQEVILGRRRSAVEAEFRLENVSSVERMRAGLVDLAGDQGLELLVDDVDEVGGTVAGYVYGDVEGLATFWELLLAGVFSGYEATFVGLTGRKDGGSSGAN